MSDIIYTPPASSGGTTINPTNNFIPVRSNATTFVDSCLWQVNADALRTVFEGTVNGLNIDHSNRQYALGQFALQNETFISVDDINRTIITYSQGTAYGFAIDRANAQMSFGDGGNNIFINSNGQYIEFQVNGGVPYALIDGYNNVGSYGGSYCAFRYNVGSYLCSIGDYLFSNNNNYIAIDDNNQMTTFRTENLYFYGTGLQSNTSSGNSGEHLVIVLNGTQYKIALQNP